MWICSTGQKLATCVAHAAEQFLIRQARAWLVWAHTVTFFVACYVEARAESKVVYAATDQICEAANGLIAAMKSTLSPLVSELCQIGALRIAQPAIQLFIVVAWILVVLVLKWKQIRIHVRT